MWTNLLVARHAAHCKALIFPSFMRVKRGLPCQREDPGVHNSFLFIVITNCHPPAAPCFLAHFSHLLLALLPVPSAMTLIILPLYPVRFFAYFSFHASTEYIPIQSLLATASSTWLWLHGQAPSPYILLPWSSRKQQYFPAYSFSGSKTFCDSRYSVLCPQPGIWGPTRWFPA